MSEYCCGFIRVTHGCSRGFVTLGSSFTMSPSCLAKQQPTQLWFPGCVSTAECHHPTSGGARCCFSAVQAGLYLPVVGAQLCPCHCLHQALAFSFSFAFLIVAGTSSSMVPEHFCWVGSCYSDQLCGLCSSFIFYSYFLIRFAVVNEETNLMRKARFIPAVFRNSSFCYLVVLLVVFSCLLPVLQLILDDK